MEQLSKVEFWKMLELVFVCCKLYKEDYKIHEMMNPQSQNWVIQRDKGGYTI